jgi:hypothetical protein
VASLEWVRLGDGSRTPGCVRPIHRVLGEITSELFRTYPELKDFDYRAWLEVRPTGQGVFGRLVGVQVARLLWKPGRDRFAVGDWGVAYELEDGSRIFVRERGRVQRFSRKRAEEVAGAMNDHLAAATAQGDPCCVSSRSGEFGSYSLLLRHGGAQPLKVVSAAPRRLDRATVIAHQTVKNFYACQRSWNSPTESSFRSRDSSGPRSRTSSPGRRADARLPHEDDG